MHRFPFRVTAMLATVSLVTACSTVPRSASKTGVDISGVNYSDMPITYIVSDPKDSHSIGAEPLDPFAAGGSMCCFRLPATWQPGIKVKVEILDTNRHPYKEEILDVPPYVDGKPGRLWAVLYQDGSVEVLSSDYGPPHEKWPGKVKGWPVPTVEYRRKLWERDLEHLKHSVHAAESLIKELRDDPETSLKSRWNHDKQYGWKKIEPFSGPDDPAYKIFIEKRNDEFLRSAREDLEYFTKNKP